MVGDQSFPPLCLLGPSGTGKSVLAMALAEKFIKQGLAVRLVSVDSAMVYQGLDIGSAKPSKDELQEYPHDLIDILPPTSSYSAGSFVKDAKALLNAAQCLGQVPILVGGTMLYFRSLLLGLADLPSADQALREELTAKAQALGWPALHQELAAIDGVTAHKISINDSQRIQRALEVFYQTGQPLSVLQTQRPAPLTAYVVAVTTHNRALLHEKLLQRIEAMLALGLLEEVKGLLQGYPELSLQSPAMKSAGYRQVFQYLHGELPWENLKDAILFSHRQLVKRQYSWLKHFPVGLTVDTLLLSMPQSLNAVYLAYQRYCTTIK